MTTPAKHNHCISIVFGRAADPMIDNANRPNKNRFVAAVFAHDAQTIRELCDPSSSCPMAASTLARKAFCNS